MLLKHEFMLYHLIDCLLASLESIRWRIFLETISISHRRKSYSITMSTWCGRFRLVCANHFVAFRGSPRSNNSADSFVRTRSGGSPGDGIAYGSFMVSCSWLRECRKSGDKVSSIAIIERWIGGTPKSFKCIGLTYVDLNLIYDVLISLRRHWNGSFRGITRTFFLVHLSVTPTTPNHYR